MRRAVRQFLVFAVVAVMAFGGGFSFAVPEMLDHSHQDGQSVLNADAASQSLHTHFHANADHSLAHSQHEKGVKSEHCLGADCDDSDHSNHPCCHMHAHCCTAHSILALGASATEPMLGKGLLLAAARAAVPLGAISYPLLRPPRDRV